MFAKILSFLETIKNIRQFKGNKMTTLDDIMVLIIERFDRIDAEIEETKDLIKRYDHEFEKEKDDN